MKKILLFPGGMPRSLAYLRQALEEGKEVLGASSLGYDPASLQYPSWVTLPYVTEPGFDAALSQVLRDHRVEGIFTPNLVIWEHLRHHLGRIAPGTSLINDFPADDDLAPYRRALSQARTMTEHALALPAAHRAARLSHLDFAAILRHAETIPGMCDQDKIQGLCEIAQHCPAGDVVEIGSWWGKSAFVLAQLAACCAIGPVLCVDPWSDEHLVQEDEHGVLNGLPLSAEEAFEVFQLNLLPYANGRLNYLRLPSSQAAAEYRSGLKVSTPGFGSTAYEGHIALLHIDGNHSYDMVRSDIDLWGGLVKDQGWIVFDDYLWPFGDGPRRAGDTFCAEQGERIKIAFVMGSALFIQVREDAAARPGRLAHQ